MHPTKSGNFKPCSCILFVYFFFLFCAYYFLVEMTFEKLTRKKLVLHKNSLNIMENIDMSNQSTQRKHSNITLKTLTAYQQMSQRERMCELFQLLDDSERHDRIVNPAAQEKLLQSTRQSLQDLKTDLAQN